MTKEILLMLIKKICSMLLLTFAIVVYAMPPVGTPGVPQMGAFNPNMSEEELLNQLMQEINAALPEDQRDAFWQEVARETERLEQETAHMAPDEKEKYLLNLISAETAPEPTAPEVLPSQPIVNVTPSKPTKPVIALEKTDDIMSLISQIVRSIESFITKAAAFPDFDGKALSWVQKGRITDWQAQGWSSFQHDLNKFVSLLERFKEKDIKIGFKHLDELAKEEVVLQNLKRLQKKLVDYEVIIKVTPFEIASMSESTKNASIHVINALTESMYQSNIPAALQKIIELFDPMAKKIREEEEKIAKNALATKRPQGTMPTRIIGRPDRTNDFMLPSFDDFGLGGRKSYDTPSMKPGSGEKESTQSDDKKGGSKSSGGTSAGKGKGGAGKGSTDTDKKKPDEKKKTETQPAQIKHTEIKKNVEDLLRKDFEDLQSTLLETSEFQSNESLKQYLLKPNPAPEASK